MKSLYKRVFDGHLTLEDANYWYKFGNGQPVTVDANLLQYKMTGSTTATVLGMDWFVHGTVNVKDGRIQSGLYNFDMKPLNAASFTGNARIMGRIALPFWREMFWQALGHHFGFIIISLIIMITWENILKLYKILCKNAYFTGKGGGDVSYIGYRCLYTSTYSPIHDY